MQAWFQKKEIWSIVMEDVLLGTSDWLYQHKMILNICSQEELMTDDEHSQLTDDA